MGVNINGALVWYSQRAISTRCHLVRQSADLTDPVGA